MSPEANESRKGFLLNHLITEELPLPGGATALSNSDPVTGQAGWYDVRVRIYKAGPEEPKETSPQFQRLHPYPGTRLVRRAWQAFFAGRNASSPE